MEERENVVESAREDELAEVRCEDAVDLDRRRADDAGGEAFGGETGRLLAEVPGPRIGDLTGGLYDAAAAPAMSATDQDGESHEHAPGFLRALRVSAHRAVNVPRRSHLPQDFRPDQIENCRR